MTGNESVHVFVAELNRLFLLKFAKVHRWSMPTDLAVGLVGDGCLVDDGVVGVALNSLLFAPVLGKDVVDIKRNVLLIELFDLRFPEEIFGPSRSTNMLMPL